MFLAFFIIRFCKYMKELVNVKKFLREFKDNRDIYICCITLFLSGCICSLAIMSLFEKQTIDKFNRELITMRDCDLYNAKLGTMNSKLNLLRYEYDVHVKMVIIDDESIDLYEFASKQFEFEFGVSNFESNSILIAYDYERKKAECIVGENLKYIFNAENERFVIEVLKQNKSSAELSYVIDLVSEKLELYYK